MHNLAEALSLMGHNVYAIDYPNRWIKISSFDFGSLKTARISNVSRAIPGSSVEVRHPGFIKIPALSRFSAAFTHFFEIKRVIKEKNIDIIILYSVATNGLQTLWLARKFGIPVVFRSIDILHRLVRNPILRLPTKIFEKMVYANVDEILAITPNHVRYVISMGAPESKVKLLLLPIDRHIFHQSNQDFKLRQKLGIADNDHVIVFIGTLFEFSGLDLFIRQFTHIAQQIPEAKLLIVGDGPQRLKLKQTIAELGLQKQVIMTGLQPYQTMPQYISLATVCINPFLDTEATRDIFPGKIIQYLACGKATVVTPLRGITALLPRDSNSIVYAHNAEEMAKEVINLLKSSEHRKRLGQAALNYVNQAHDQQNIARQFEKELHEIIGKKLVSVD